MNCEGVRAVLAKGYSATTVAERNASCVHCRACADCQAMLIAEVMHINKTTPPVQVAIEVIASRLALARDRADPEWK